jgi:PAS domain S-box-containing protein
VSVRRYTLGTLVRKNGIADLRIVREVTPLSRGIPIAMSVAAAHSQNDSVGEFSMQSQDTEIGQFISTFSRQRHVVLSRAASIIDPAVPEAEPRDETAQLSALLATSLEELKVCEEELLSQQESFTSTRDEVEQRLQHYRDLFELVPTAILFTDLNGSVREANRAACIMLQRSAYHLDRKPLAALVPRSERAAFRQGLARLSLTKGASQWRFRLERQTHTSIEVCAAVELIRSSNLGTSALLWHLQPVEHKDE